METHELEDGTIARIEWADKYVSITCSCGNDDDLGFALDSCDSCTCSECGKTFTGEVIPIVDFIIDGNYVGDKPKSYWWEGGHK